MKTRIAVFVACAALAACSRSGRDDHAFEWSAELPAGSIVHIRNGAGDVEIKRADGQDGHIVGSRHWRRGRSRDVNFVVTQRGNEYYICAMWRNSGKCAERGYRGKNTGGFLALFSLFNRTTDARADFVAEMPANVVIDVRNTSGDIAIDGISGGVSATTVNGDVQAMNVGGKIRLETVNGELKLAADPSASLDAISLNTTNGDVHAALPPGSEGAFDLSTTNGDVQTDFPLESTSKSPVSRHLRGQVGSSARTVKVRTVNGSVVVSQVSGAPEP